MKRYDAYRPSGIDWIGDIPQHWEVKPIKFTSKLYNGDSLNDKQKEDYSSEKALDSIPYIASKDISRDTAIVDYDNGVNIPNSEQGFSIASAGSTLLCIEGGSAGKKMAYLNQDVCFVNKLCCFDSNLNSKFNYYVICSNSFTEPFFKNLQGMIGGVSISDIKNISIIVPPLAEQEAIAEYLDNKCGAIDKVIATQRRRVELLGELKQSIITQAVTHGLNPDVTLRPSGIDWIGNIPEHWETSPLKYTGEFGNGLTFSPEDVCDDGIIVLRSQNIQDSKLDFSDNLYVKDCPEKLLVKPNDIIICSRNGSVNLVGKCAKVSDSIVATFGAFMMRYRPIINSSFAFYLFQSAYKEYRGLFATTTINQLTKDSINQMYVPIPPFAEQEAIAEYLDKKCATIDKSIAKAEREIELLTELKQSIISEAVTGKIKVTD